MQGRYEVEAIASRLEAIATSSKKLLFSSHVEAHVCIFEPNPAETRSLW